MGHASRFLPFIVLAVVVAVTWLPLRAIHPSVVRHGIVFFGRLAAVRIERFDELDPSPRAALGPATIGWLDWLLASAAFTACLQATGAAVARLEATRSFFFGQAIGIASLVPGGFGS